MRGYVSRLGRFSELIEVPFIESRKPVHVDRLLLGPRSPVESLLETPLYTRPLA